MGATESTRRLAANLLSTCFLMRASLPKASSHPSRTGLLWAELGSPTNPRMGTGLLKPQGGAVISPLAWVLNSLKVLELVLCAFGILFSLLACSKAIGVLDSTVEQERKPLSLLPPSRPKFICALICFVFRNRPSTKLHHAPGGASSFKLGLNNYK